VLAPPAAQAYLLVHERKNLNTYEVFSKANYKARRAFSTDMSTHVQDYPEHFHRILKRYTSLMSQLDVEYKKSQPDNGESDFKEKVFEQARIFLTRVPSLAALLDDNLTIKKLSDSIAQDRERLESDVAFIHFGCTYAIAAMMALEIQDRDLAWDFLCQANFYLGVVMFTDRSNEILTKAVVNTHKTAMAVENATKRHQSSNDMKAKAYEIMRSRPSWRSQSEAADRVVAALEKEYGDKFEFKNPKATVTNWIKAMPDRLKLIPSLGERLGQS